MAKTRTTSSLQRRFTLTSANASSATNITTTNTTTTTCKMFSRQCLSYQLLTLISVVLYQATHAHAFDIGKFEFLSISQDPLGPFKWYWICLPLNMIASLIVIKHFMSPANFFRTKFQRPLELQRNKKKLLLPLCSFFYLPNMCKCLLRP